MLFDGHGAIDDVGGVIAVGVGCSSGTSVCVVWNDPKSSKKDVLRRGCMITCRGRSEGPNNGQLD
jgi:hypothetical protein